MISTTSAGLETVLEKVGRSLSERFGIRVICQGNRCCTDGKVIHLPSLPDELPEELLQVIRGYVDHESGHILGNSDFKIAGDFKRQHGPDAFYFLNCLEDLRIEEIMRRRFPGSAANLDHSYRFAVAEVERQSDSLPVLRRLAFGVYTRGNGSPELSFVGQEVYRALDIIADAVGKAANCRTTREVAKLAEAAWPVIVRELSLDQQTSGFDVGQSGNTSQAPQSSPPGQSAPTHAKTPPSSRNSSHVTTSSDHTIGKHSISSQTAGNTSNNRADVTRSACGPDIMQGLAEGIVKAINAYSRQNEAYRVWNAGYDRAITAPDRQHIPYHVRMAALLPLVAGVRQRLLQTLLAEPKARWLGDREEGGVNPRALHRLATAAPDREGHGRVFREKVRTKRLRTAVTLLVDQSNSMRGSRIKLGGETALVFCEALERLNIPVSVVGFSTGPYEHILKEAQKVTGMKAEELQRLYRLAPLRHTHYKHFHENLRSVSGRFDEMQPQSLTPLGESMLFAARELFARPEQRKVLFVMTDGRPVVGLDDDSITFNHAKTAIKRIETAGIDVALVGILESSVAALHHRSVVVNSLAELPRTVMGQLQNLLSVHS